MAELRVTILGCGSSGGVPRLGDDWGACDRDEPKNRRLRCSVLLERADAGGVTRALIDTSPDMRAQLLAAGVGALDGVAFTHSHADHVHGLDDLRMIVFNMRRRLPVWADRPTRDALMDRFRYAFEQPEGSPYPPILDLHEIGKDVTISGAGGPIRLTPIPVHHGSIDALGFRIDDVAYIPDANAIPEASWPLLHALDCWIVDALRRTPHPSHSHLDNTLGWIARAAPQQAVLTNLHVDMDYATLSTELPAHIRPAHDGLTLTFEV